VKKTDFKFVLNLIEEVTARPHDSHSSHKPDLIANPSGSFLSKPGTAPGTSSSQVASAANTSTSGASAASSSNNKGNTPVKPVPPPPVPPMAPLVPKKLSAGARIPIIIVPAAATSLISLLNVKKFLENEQFMTNQEAKDQGMKKETMITVIRKKGKSDSVPYHVVDSVTKLKIDDWARVVAVFALGPTWQFKGWPNNWQFPADHFANVRGFHLNYDDAKLDENIKKWSIVLLQVHKTKRHLDGVAVVKFWTEVDKFIAKNKPYLTY
jgi:parafibromin